MLTFPRFKLCLGVLISILAMSGFAFAQDESVRKEIESLYAKRDEAFKAKDASFIKSLLADDYTDKDKDGKITNRADFIKTIENSFADKDVKEISNSTKIKTVKQGKDGNEMLVDTSQTIKFTFMIDGQTSQLQLNGKFRDTWMRTDSGWKLKFSEMLDLDMTTNAVESVYKFKEAGVKFVVPAGWKVEKNKDGSITVSGKDGDGYIVVTMTTFGPETSALTPKAQFKLFAERVLPAVRKDLKGFQSEEPTDVTNMDAGVQMIDQEFKGTKDGVEMDGLLWLLLFDKPVGIFMQETVNVSGRLDKDRGELMGSIKKIE